MLFKKMFRDMNKHKMQFIAIFLMSFLTLWIFSGVGAEVAGIQQTVNEFYDETDMADMWVYSENLGNDSINQIKEISTTEDFERQLIVRSTANISGNPTLTLHFIEKNKLSKYYPVDGDKFNMDDEEGIWLDKRFADAHNLKIGDKIEKVSPESVSVADIVIVKQGEKVPLDGVIVKGIASLDVAALTGESILKEAGENDGILSGSIVVDGIIDRFGNMPPELENLLDIARIKYLSKPQ